MKTTLFGIEYIVRLLISVNTLKFIKKRFSMQKFHHFRHVMPKFKSGYTNNKTKTPSIIFGLKKFSKKICCQKCGTALHHPQSSLAPPNVFANKTKHLNFVIAKSKVSVMFYVFIQTRKQYGKV